ncbi:MAG: glycerophosphodiester phosphodiesterase [Chloroflexi bacterium]|nr:glycerophosphodiester phosphodiesterase [Chloroflexota bacterium]
MTLSLLRSQTGRVLVESHRGADKLAPENSWTAIELGWQSGADFIEIDVQMTADGELVIYHNYRAPDGRLIREMRRNEVALVCAGDNHLVGLEDIFEWAARNEAKFSLDIKNGFDFERAVFERALALVNQYDFTERVMFIGWDHHAIRWIKETQPQTTTRALVRGRPVNLVEVARASRADAISLSYDLTSRAEVDALHEAGVAVMLAELFEPDFARAVAVGADLVSYGDPIAALRELRKR